MFKYNLINKRTTSGLIAFLMVLVLFVTWLSPLLVGNASAAGQITSRSLSLSTAVPSATGVTYTFTFTIPSTVQVQGLKFTACTTAIGSYPGGTCTAPTGMTGAGNGFTSAAWASQTGWQGATNFATDLTGANDCTASGNVLCAKRTDTTAQTATSRTIAFNTIKNPSSANTAFYVGITTYTTNTWTLGSVVDAGTAAAAIVQTLTVNANVPELLNFCVGSTTVDDATTSVGSDCTAISGSSLNIGTLDPSSVNVSPVTTNGGDSKNGVAMLRTNAQSGATISYDAVQQSGTNHQGTLRISGSSCNVGSVNTDGCINAAGATQTAFTAGNEDFGMTVAGINKGSTTSYSCSYTASPNTCKLEPSTNYLGAGAAGTESYGSSNGFAWVESGAATQIASSAGVVDDEAVILKFAATPSIITPFGSYAAQADFIAAPTF